MLSGLAVSATLASAATGELSQVDRPSALWGWLTLALVALCLGLIFAWRYSVELRKHRKRLEKSYVTAEHVFASSDRDSVFQTVVDAAPEQLNASNAQVLLLNASEQQLSYVAGSDGPARGAVSIASVSGVVTCFRAREITEVPDASKCSFIDAEWVKKRKLKSALYVPIVSGDSCLGVLEIEDRKRKRSFNPEQKALAAHLARLAALGVRLYDQRSMTEQLHRGEKLAAISELAHAMAQELESPFAEIQRLATDNSLPATAGALDERLQDIAAQITGAKASLDRLVRFSSPQSGEKQDVDLNSLVRAVVAEAKRRPDQDLLIKLSVSKRTPIVRADPTHLQQVFQILLRHARHFLRQLQGRSLQIHTTLRDRRVVVAMAPLATPDQPLRGSLAKAAPGAQSSSLGLSICQALIERAGGSLQIDPTSSLGFRIEVEYPLSRTPAEAASSSGDGWGKAPRAMRSGPITALIVEPDERLQAILLQQLSEQSIRAIPVSTAEEAVALCARVSFDWVFCELQMRPVSGVRIYEKVRSRIERFVFIADEAACASNPEIFRSSEKAVLRKPFTTEDVDALLEELQSGAVLQDA